MNVTHWLCIFGGITYGFYLGTAASLEGDFRALCMVGIIPGVAVLAALVVKGVVRALLSLR